jgi:hypothetical protein
MDSFGLGEQDQVNTGDWNAIADPPKLQSLLRISVSMRTTMAVLS